MMAIHNGMDDVTAHSPASPYAISKLDCEYLARMFYTDHGLRTTCLRYFNVYGPRQDPNSAYAAAIQIFLSRARAGIMSITNHFNNYFRRRFTLINADATLNQRKSALISVLKNTGKRDCAVCANVAAMEHGDGEVFNVATGASVTILEQLSGSLVVTLRNRLTEEALREMGLNERQLKVISYFEEKESITNKEYQMLFDVSRITATRDLNLLEGKNMLKRIGTGKRDLKYLLK